MSNKTKQVLKVAAGIAAVASICTMAFASTGAGASTSSVASIVGTFLGYVRDIFISIGVLLGVYAIGQLALAFKDDNPDQKSKAMMLLVCCAILIAIAPLMKTIISAAGATNLVNNLGTGFLGLNW